ncbi:hypothetical protein PoB_005910600 [Plakobranchus ocellatus]|uniref:Uncharacterized protein n=1 Tax=Plakobranchus ocellatus TaxID=259542 RepID=A0AAV4CIA7_9GAST|nr:hypothetical protein PoB_005910600 [Plakobranchus ocellatus]
MLSTNIYYIIPNRSSVLATVHQGMSASKALSRQCMFNALAIAVANEKLSVEPGRGKLDVDRFLKVGDWLCINPCILEAFPIVDGLEGCVSRLLRNCFGQILDTYADDDEYTPPKPKKPKQHKYWVQPGVKTPQNDGNLLNEV